MLAAKTECTHSNTPALLHTHSHTEKAKKAPLNADTMATSGHYISAGEVLTCWGRAFSAAFFYRTRGRAGNEQRVGAG